MNATAAASIREAAALERQGRLAEAIVAYERALRDVPAQPDVWYNLGRLQRRIGAPGRALESYLRALEHGVRRPEEVHLNRGVIYADDLRRDDDAEREYQCALACNPAYVPAWLNLGNLREDLGAREAARTAYQRALELDDRCVLALARLANLITAADPPEASEPLILRLQGVVADSTFGAADHADAGFSLGRLLDAVGRYPAAFAAYTAANRASRASAPPGTGVYDRAAAEQFVDRLIAAFPLPRSLPAPNAASGAADGRPAVPEPLFICGMFRSGSTLVEQLLAGHPAVAAGGELDFIPRTAAQTLAPFPESMAAQPPARLAALAARHLEALGALHPGASWVTDKRPDNVMYIGLIKTLFPAAKIVHTRRDPVDNCLSIFFLHLDQRMSYALDLMDTAHHYREYQRLMAHWRALYGADLIEVDYDVLVREPRPVAGRLLEGLGLAWDDRCLAPLPPGRAVKTASVWQVREPIHTRASGRARHYSNEVAGLRAYLAEPR